MRAEGNTHFHGILEFGILRDSPIHRSMERFKASGPPLAISKWDGNGTATFIALERFNDPGGHIHCTRLHEYIDAPAEKNWSRLSKSRLAIRLGQDGYKAVV